MSDARPPAPPPLTFIARFTVAVGTPIDLGEGGRGQRRFIPVVGGTIEGPYLTGRILAGGGDWQTVQSDGVIELAARYTLELDDGTRIEFDNRGVRHAHPQTTTARPAAPGDYYFQTTARLNAPLGSYQWMTRTIFVAAAERRAGGVGLDLFALGDFR